MINCIRKKLKKTKNLISPYIHEARPLVRLPEDDVGRPYQRLSRENPLALKPASHVLLDSSTRPHRVEPHFVICASSLVQYALITCAQCVCAWSHTNTLIYIHAHTVYTGVHTMIAGTAFATCRMPSRDHRDRATSVLYGIGHHTGMKDVRIARIHTHSPSSYIHTLAT